MWKIEFKKLFLKELSHLPVKIRTRVEEIVFNELKCDSPYNLGFIQKLKGYKDKYKIRIGNFRLGLTIDKNKMTIICEIIADRKNIYKRFP